jgi:hypothetical protein
VQLFEQRKTMGVYASTLRPVRAQSVQIEKVLDKTVEKYDAFLLSVLITAPSREDFQFYLEHKKEVAHEYDIVQINGYGRQPMPHYPCSIKTSQCDTIFAGMSHAYEAAQDQRLVLEAIKRVRAQAQIAKEMK